MRNTGESLAPGTREIAAPLHPATPSQALPFSALLFLETRSDRARSRPSFLFEMRMVH